MYIFWVRLRQGFQTISADMRRFHLLNIYMCRPVRKHFTAHGIKRTVAKWMNFIGTPSSRAVRFRVYAALAVLAEAEQKAAWDYKNAKK